MKKLLLLLSLIFILTSCQSRNVEKYTPPHTPETQTTSESTLSIISDNSSTEQAEPKSDTNQNEPIKPSTSQNNSNISNDSNAIKITTDSALTQTDPTPTNEESSSQSQLNSDSVSISDESDAPVIIAKSEDLEPSDESTMLLKELDEMIDSTLNLLDTMEEDMIADENIIQEGGF